MTCPAGFSGVSSFDIYKKIKPYRNLLGLDNLKQKSIEQFLGIARTDKYNGGQLIEVYKDYLMTHEQNLYDLLILHNEDDLKGMPSILPILNYPDFLEHPFTLSDQEIVDEPDANGHFRHLFKADLQKLLFHSDPGRSVHGSGTLQRWKRIRSPSSWN
ncbi:MAG: ribonuclease H-like domain-containing protein [Clostridium sp.]